MIRTMKNFFANLFASKPKAQPVSTPPKARPPREDVRAQYGFPPKIDDFFGEVSPAEDAPGWDYQLWVEEWAEPYLGSKPFASLERRFASVQGVTGVAHMDREVFLIKSKLDAARLRELLWPHFIEAAQDGVGHDA